jgi:hypothetical protein
MSTIIAASVLVPLSIAAAAYAVDKLEQGTTEKEEQRTEGSFEQDNDKGPDDLVDFSGGRLGIL